MLVIQEKSGPAAGIGLWKLPGGLVDPKEDISVAAAREVREETGVAARFRRLCSVQENHAVRGPGREGSTDLYCIAYLAPEEPGAVPVPQECEIAPCRWMPFDELLAQPVYSVGPRPAAPRPRSSDEITPCLHAARCACETGQIRCLSTSVAAPPCGCGCGCGGAGARARDAAACAAQGGMMRQALRSALRVARGEAEGLRAEELEMSFRPGTAVLNHPPP